MSLCMKPVKARKIEQAIPVGNFFIEDSLFMFLFLCVWGQRGSAFLAAQAPLTRYFQSDFQKHLSRANQSESQQDALYRIEYRN